jgi:glycosyltransferase involved in cell wall biosynthesis
MSANPVVSCVIPVFNGERFIADCLESVLQQTYDAMEIVVVNDGSTDGTKAILGGYGARITVIDQPNAGVKAARNRGMAAASGAIIAFQDADDLWLAEKTQLQVDRLTRNPEAGLCTCMMENFWESEVAHEAEQLRGTKHDGARLTTLPGIMVRQDAFDRIGGFNTDTGQNDETASLLFHAKAAGVPVEHVDQVLVRRRIHGDNMSRRQDEGLRTDLLKLAEAAIARRRASNAKP